MSSGIESVEKVKGIDEKGHPTSFLRINLNSGSPFDISRLDMLVKDVFLDIKRPGRYELKYLVESDNMYIFQGTMTHQTAKTTLAGIGIDNDLQSAGSVDLIFHAEAATAFYRSINGKSMTLLELSYEDSDWYKETVIKVKLGSYFDIRED